MKCDNCDDRVKILYILASNIKNILANKVKNNIKICRYCWNEYRNAGVELPRIVESKWKA